MTACLEGQTSSILGTDLQEPGSVALCAGPSSSENLMVFVEIQCSNS